MQVRGIALDGQGPRSWRGKSRRPTRSSRRRCVLAEPRHGNDAVVDLQSHQVGVDANGHADPPFDGKIGKPVTNQVTTAPDHSRSRANSPDAVTHLTCSNRTLLDVIRRNHRAWRTPIQGSNPLSFTDFFGKTFEYRREAKGQRDWARRFLRFRRLLRRRRRRPPLSPHRGSRARSHDGRRSR
jgi:hypothetical protein